MRWPVCRRRRIRSPGSRRPSQYKITDSFSVSLEGRNLLDEYYFANLGRADMLAGFETWGRSYLAGRHGEILTPSQDRLSWCLDVLDDHFANTGEALQLAGDEFRLGF